MQFKVTIAIDEKRLKELLIDSLGLTTEKVSDFELNYNGYNGQNGLIVSYKIECQPDPIDCYDINTVSKIAIR